MPPSKTDYRNAPIGLQVDGQPRGPQFFAIYSDIARQFELIQQTWCTTFDAKFFVGDNDGTGLIALPAESYRRRIGGMPRFVTMLGAGYFFLPGIAALRYLAGQ